MYIKSAETKGKKGTGNRLPPFALSASGKGFWSKNGSHEGGGPSVGRETDHKKNEYFPWRQRTHPFKQEIGKGKRDGLFCSARMKPLRVGGILAKSRAKGLGQGEFPAIRPVGRLLGGAGERKQDREIKKMKKENVDTKKLRKSRKRKNSPLSTKEESQLRRGDRMRSV